MRYDTTWLSTGMEVFGAKSALDSLVKVLLHSIYSNILLKDHVSYLYRYQSFWHGVSIFTINYIGGIDTFGIVLPNTTSHWVR